MIPQFMTKIFYVLEVRIEKSHQLDNGLRITLAFFGVVEAHQVFDHLLDMPAVLPHDEIVPRCVVFHSHDYCFFYKPTLKCRYRKFRDGSGPRRRRGGKNEAKSSIPQKGPGLRGLAPRAPGAAVRGQAIHRLPGHAKRPAKRYSH